MGCIRRLWFVFLAPLTILAYPSSAMITVPGPVPGMEFVEIPGETFPCFRLEDPFGNVLEEGDSMHVNSYQVMTTEVTQGVWELVMGVDVEEYLAAAGVEQIGPEYPMCNLSYGDCVDFVNALEALDPAYTYTIPPYRYWFHSCRAGTYTAYPWGEDSLEAIGFYCWFTGNSGDTLHPVATRAPNAWGLYDMCGNVYEWVRVSGGLRDVDPETGDTVCTQPLCGGSYLSDARTCRTDLWIPADIEERYQSCGLRVFRRPAPADTVLIGYIDWDRRPYDPGEENRFELFAEPGLSIGGINHTFDDDDIEQFGYDMRGGCEQDGFYLRGGLGKRFGNLGIGVYGEVGYIGPGSLFDGHGPWILPEVLLRMNILAIGAEVRYWIFRGRFGYGSYGGEADIKEDTVGATSPGMWTTDIVDGRGWHYGIGVGGVADGWIGGGVEWVQHFVDLRLAETGTGIEPTQQHATQSELRIFATLMFRFDKLW